MELRTAGQHGRGHRGVRSIRRVHGVLAALALLQLAGCGGDDAPASSSRSASPAPSAPSGEAARPGPARESYVPGLRALERAYDARLGVYAVDTGSGREVAYHDDERFPYASTFKALAAGALLREESPDGMDRVITYARSDLIAYSPVTERHVEDGMSLTALCEAAVRFSDNTAANLLLDRLGGPHGLDARLADLGDGVTRMERREPELGRWTPGDTRDTSTPRALAGDLRAYVLGDVLDSRDRARLTTWLRTNTTGDALIRAGVPDGWVVGDKTGTGSTYGARNDIAVVWPPDGDPIVMTILSNGRDEDADPEDELIAKAASVVAGALS